MLINCQITYVKIGSRHGCTQCFALWTIQQRSDCREFSGSWIRLWLEMTGRCGRKIQLRNEISKYV